MCDFITLPVSHALIMRDDSVMDQVQYYLRAGRFSHWQEEGQEEEEVGLADNRQPRPAHCTSFQGASG